jgi:hypothetical protein
LDAGGEIAYKEAQRTNKKEIGYRTRRLEKARHTRKLSILIIINRANIPGRAAKHTIVVGNTRINIQEERQRPNIPGDSAIRKRVLTKRKENPVLDLNLKQGTNLQPQK